MTTPIATFSAHVETFLTQTILPTVVDHCTKKGYSVSIEELMESLKITTRHAPAVSHAPVPAGIAAAPRGRVTQPAAPVGDSGGCVYKFIRGANKDKPCGKPTVDGTQYCKQCVKKKKGGGQEGAPSAPKSQFTGGIIGAAPSAPFQAAQSSSNELDVTKLSEDPLTYVTTKERFVITPDGDDFIVHYKLDGDRQTDLTPQDIQRAKEIGLRIAEQTKVASVSATPSIPTITPSVPVITQGLSTVGGSSVGVPSIPTMPQFKQ